MSVDSPLEKWFNGNTGTLRELVPGFGKIVLGILPDGRGVFGRSFDEAPEESLFPGTEGEPLVGQICLGGVALGFQLTDIEAYLFTLNGPILRVVADLQGRAVEDPSVVSAEQQRNVIALLESRTRI